MPDAIPTRVTGTEPVSELEDGVPASPTPMPSIAYGMAICQYGVSSRPEQEHQPNATKMNDCTDQQCRARAPIDGTSLAERGATSTMNITAGRIAAPASIVE